MKWLFAVCVAALLSTGAVSVAAVTAVDWSDASSAAYVDSDAPNRQLLIVRQAGMPDGSDNTRVVTTPDGAKHHSSGYQVVDVTVPPFNVPADAKTVTLSFKGVLTKGLREGQASVYAFVRRHGSTCCQGVGPGNEDYPTDHYDIPGMVTHVVSNLPRDGDRSCCATYDVPLVDGKFEFSWGYIRVEGVYPDGDTVGVAVFLNGWTR